MKDEPLTTKPSISCYLRLGDERFSEVLMAKIIDGFPKIIFCKSKIRVLVRKYKYEKDVGSLLLNPRNSLDRNGSYFSL